MTYRYQLRVLGSEDDLHDYSTFGEASQAIAASVRDAEEPWELVRISDVPGTCTDVLRGAGPRAVTIRSAVLRHYPRS